MNIENEMKRLNELKLEIDNDLDEIYSAFEKEELYFADVEMYENALLKANKLSSMAVRYMDEVIILRKKLVGILEERSGMKFEDLFFDFLIEVDTRDELDRLISEINYELIVAKYQVVEANNLREDKKREVAE